MEEHERQDEARLIGEVLAGDRAAFVRLIGRYQRLVRLIVFRMIPDQRDREELCQDVFVKVHRHLGSFRREAKLSTWIARIARNTCLNHLAKRQMPLYSDMSSGEEQGSPQRIARVPSQHRDPAENTRVREVRAFVHAAVERLPEHYRTALTLYHLAGMSIQEISEVMDNPPGTVKSHLYRARKKLKDQLLAQYTREELQP